MKRAWLIILVAVGLVVVAIFAFEIAYWGKIYPGVSVAGMNLGNLTPVQAQDHLQSLLIAQPLTLTWNNTHWTISPQDINLQYDAQASVAKALRFGRQGQVWASWPAKYTAFTTGVDLSPVFSWQENQVVASTASISAQINIPAREPEIVVEAGEVKVLPGENGQVVDEQQLQLNLQQAVGHLPPTTIAIPVIQLRPQLTSAQAQTLRLRAEKLLNKKLVLINEGQKWDIDNQDILAWLDVNNWKRLAIETWVQQLATGIDRPAQNALFNFVTGGRVEEFKPAQDGLTVDQEKLTTAIITALSQLEQSQEVPPLTIPVSHVAPTITTAAVNNLGIKELIGHGQSDYTGSIPNRVFNLSKAAKNFNGVLVAPGETFSFNKYVGDISAAGGYKPAYIIKEGRTILGDGGGVCQVSTTLFRATLNAGLPIVERNAHAYRVHYYENDSGPGIDATIFTPSVDFKFTNDTPGYILIQTSIDTQTRKLIFDLYGTSDGRVATITKPKIWDVTPPPPDLYTDDPTLAPNTVKQVDFKAWGAKVSFDYKVVRNGEVLQSRTFYSNFRPWQAIFLRGPQG